MTPPPALGFDVDGLLNSPAKSPSELLATSVKALYEAKRAGRQPSQHARKANARSFTRVAAGEKGGGGASVENEEAQPPNRSATM